MILSNFETMSFFKRKYREYDYQPRYYKSDKEGNPFRMENKFDQFRSTTASTRGFKRKVDNVLADSHLKGDRYMRLRLLVIIAILVLVFLFIIDFDLSIFFGK